MTDKTNQPVETTTVEEVDVNLENLLGVPGADSVITGAGAEKKPGMFSKPGVEMTFLDNPQPDSTKEDDEEEQEEENAGENNPPAGTKEDPKNKAASKKAPPATVEEIINEEEDDDKASKKKLNKGSMVQAVSALVKKGVIKPFDDDKPLEEYSVQDLEELIEVNLSEKEKELRERTPVEFFDSLPPELQYAAKYIADGGDDLKGLFKVLAQVEETRELDPKENAEDIARRYLTAKNFGKPEDIEEEIAAWKDRGELEKKAEKFKPILDSMHEQQVQMRLKQQEDLRKRQAAQTQAYMKNVYEVLEPGSLNGLKLDQKTQGMLYAGLVNPSYPSVSGRQTNMLGHLLEKYQFVEPNHSLVAEALWLLADPDGYRTKVRESASKEQNEKTLRLLKQEQANKKSGAGDDESENNTKQRKPGTVSRPTGNIFRRE